MKKIYGYELQNKGGSWLAAARSFLQNNVRGGDTNTWGSHQTVTLTMNQIEELAANVAAAVMNDKQ